jgi:hypothetical protein
MKSVAPDPQRHARSVTLTELGPKCGRYRRAWGQFHHGYAVRTSSNVNLSWRTNPRDLCRIPQAESMEQLVFPSHHATFPFWKGRAVTYHGPWMVTVARVLLNHSMLKLLTELR